MSLEQAKNILSKILRSKGLSSQAQAAWVCREAEFILARTFKDSGTQVVSFSNGVLTVDAPTSGWAQEIQLREEKLIKKINQRIKMKLVKRIRIRMG